MIIGRSINLIPTWQEPSPLPENPTVIKLNVSSPVTFTINTSSGELPLIIDWGDGTTEKFTYSISHGYAVGLFDIKIYCEAENKWTLVEFTQSTTGTARIQEFHFGAGLTEVGLEAFSGQSELSKVSIDDLKDWFNITFDSLHSNPLTIAHDLYVGDELLVDLVVPQLTDIKNYAFYGSSIRKVYLTGLVNIGSFAFHSCASLTEVYQDNDDRIGTYTYAGDVFFGCTSLSKVFVHIGAYDGHLKFEGDYSNPLYYARRLYRIDNGAEINTIDSTSSSADAQYKYIHCDSLVSATMTSVGKSEFEGCKNLRSVDLSFSSSIAQSAFSGCTSLESLTLRSSKTVTLDTDALKDVPLTCKIYVPSGSVNSYKSNSAWADRKDYIFAIS